MPSSRAVPTRRKRADDDDDSEESSSNSSRYPTPGSQKRSRVEAGVETEDDEDTAGNSGQNSDDDDSEVPEPSTQITQTQSGDTQNGHSEGVDKNGYKPGAIVRIKVTDFVTYTSAEFFPGPKLNMVIGPNGTGKSTLVCAICLGLGWGPQHLGRAKDPGEFVKHGCREAIIEIELAGGARFRRNPVVSRTIKREGNKSSFTLNRKPVSRTAVLKLAQSFAIQIDNLCQFLPQDKVSEFAALTPIELLHSTQRAAAGPEMVEWHDDLKKLRAQQKKLQMDNQGDKDSLTNLENRQEMQRADVERMRERAVIKRKIEILETLRPIARYRQHHEELKNMKQKKDELLRELEQLKTDLEPALRAVNAKQNYVLQLHEVEKHQQGIVDEADAKATKLGKKIEQYENSMKDLGSQIDAEKKSSTNYKQEAGKIQQNINRLTRQLNEEGIEFDVDWYNEKIREKRREMRELEVRGSEIKEERRPHFEKLKEFSTRINRAEEQLKGLDSQAGRQEAKLEAASRHSYQAYKWLLKNQDKFEKEVFGPPIVTCSVTDPKYADPVESIFQRTDFTTFTTQTRNDFKTLQRALNIDMKLHDISIRTCSIPLDSLRPPISDDELKNGIGFDGWAKDYLAGPEPVLAMLCSENRLHQTPITLRDISDEEFGRLENGPISSWVTRKQTYQVMRRREYGPSASSTRVRQVKPAKVWTSQPVDASAKHELQQQIEGWKNEAREVQEKIDADKTTLKRLGDQHNELDREKVNLEREKSDKQTAFTNYRALPERIRQQEAKQKDFYRFFEETRNRVLEIRGQQDQVAIKKAEAAIAYANAVDDLRTQHEQLIKLKVQLIEGRSDFTTLKDRSAEHRDLLQSKDKEVQEAHRIMREASKNGREMVVESQRVIQLSNSQPDLKEELSTMGTNKTSVDQLEADIDSEKARLELTQGGSANIIKEFEERERQIEKLRNNLADFHNQLAEYDHAINEIRGKWEPKLDALVKSISDAFSDSFARIGCAGQVSLDKAEDEAGPDGQTGGSNFDQWSIQIHVKFREHESLSLLDSHRQSGGERAVSTIFYLMALQSLSASPFRVVDEINQGMDPRNERMVHGRLVDIACAAGNNAADGVGGGGGGQYFLITPKLLSGLVYKPGMRVLCIVSGEHMPRDYNELNFGQAIQTMRKVNEQRDQGRAIQNTMRSNGHVDVNA
ncbi:hypothetical protein ASPWEDRAFT_35838 [Aspergillus wentii DTO 134E9]|uniref:Structural maintenance of chromosomes protein 5 n=1 Tax=Aspergillus wentii DTO 134E9 TaxID=1073089 RepID=A0A1L9RTL2_ASPWE|nr:uncharacterized protein ASPWEDRAFT_35838 [Aspergillus wentii DTO 134E9]KAI9933870.1 Structural maintenance of chromosomes protein 5 [Aspergillus wentii]OJJ38223.1 hypothetical protein ASPWEDRAFT_35838 [Aspergillus wentii DTO 134E9]